MEAWIYVVGVVVLLFIISQKTISSPRSRVDANKDEAARDKLEGKTSALQRMFEKMG
jgi:hypothetical protein